ncbi:DUF6427 family protein [uncultured Aquimarina sp.]|uniref:DUF6427 family protein n=1 Tax=uncultured Aquimarina sp. TaxID=575652 RepID=UPI0026166D99|nr:DUF6427 family protein [uncultured Aquimarina sp.]
MLSSFFSKSKPINFIIVGLYMFLLYVTAYYKTNFSLDYISILMFFGGSVVYILAMLVLNLVTQKNDLTQKSTNTILLFAFLTALLPNSLINPYILLANLLVILGIRSTLSLRNGKHIKSKILDASLFISLASVAYFWSIGFMIFVFLGILFFEPKNYRNWLIPGISLIATYVLSNCFTLLVYDNVFTIFDYVDPISFSFSNYVNQQSVFSVGVITICALFFFTIYFLRFNRKSTKLKPILRLIISQWIIALAIIAIAPNKNTSEIVFVTAPLAIIGTTYLEMDQGKLVKEINIWIFLLLPFVILLF